ncbi:MAG: hypothetical protein J0H49_28970 [Acidobacteria bacterium]|nr:hypothetical protein [Acidobacteriota bacterium]
MNPIILRFAQRIPAASPEVLRYDAERQIAEVLEGGQWVDRLTVGGQGASTKFTKVKNETTDDD